MPVTWLLSRGPVDGEQARGAEISGIMRGWEGAGQDLAAKKQQLELCANAKWQSSWRSSCCGRERREGRERERDLARGVSRNAKLHGQETDCRQMAPQAHTKFSPSAAARQQLDACC